MTILYILTGTTFSAPGNWPGSGQVDCIGAGGAGQNANNATATGGAGGGGGHSTSPSVVAANGVTIQVGVGGVTAGANGTATWFSGATLAASEVGANPGAGAAAAGTGGAGGSTTGATGTTKEVKEER